MAPGIAAKLNFSSGFGKKDSKDTEEVKETVFEEKTIVE